MEAVAATDHCLKCFDGTCRQYREYDSPIHCIEGRKGKRHSEAKHSEE
jgi:hypothetical protein